MLAEGKAIVSKNATRHGILSREVPLDSQERRLYDEHCSLFYEQFDPQGEYENLLIDRMASCAWRLGRIIRVETSMFTAARDDQFNYHRNTRNAFTGSAKDSMAVLSRYEAFIEKSLYKASHELHRLQALRKGAIAAHFEIVSCQKGEEEENGFVS